MMKDKPYSIVVVRSLTGNRGATHNIGIPKNISEKLGLEAGDYMMASIKDNGIFFKKIEIS